ncbi:MAG: DNA polymerase III subunit delta [Fuerstiella sp.]
MHATEFLADHDALPAVPVLVLYGSERYLKLAVLKRIPGLGDDDDQEATVTRVAGKEADLRSVCDELLTVSMFGDRRIVLVENADDFVSENRAGLEKYVASPAKTSLLVLDVKSWPKNTKLAKATDKIGLNLECGEMKGAALRKWLIKTAHQQHNKQLDNDTAALIIELAGDSLGLLEQELNKLASLVGDVEVITQDDVTRVVGGWRIQTTWAMLDAIRDGKVGTAIDYLDRLILAGDAPQKVLGGLTFTFRKLAEATELARQTRDLSTALRTAGVFPAAVGPSEQYLKRIGFDKASRIFQLLVEADANMKGGSRIDPKLQLEALFVTLAG